MMRRIIVMMVLASVAASSFAVAGEDVYRNAEKIESKTFLLQKEQEYQQALTQLETLKRQAEKERIQQEVELADLRKKHREISGSTSDPKVLAIMGMEPRLEAVLSFSDGSSKTFRTGDVLPGGGKIAGITESEVLVTKPGKKLVTLAYETPKAENTMEFSVYQPGAAPQSGVMQPAMQMPAPQMQPMGAPVQQPAGSPMQPVGGQIYHEADGPEMSAN